jgi:hypothetical protein
MLIVVGLLLVTGIWQTWVLYLRGWIGSVELGV